MIAFSVSGCGNSEENAKVAAVQAALDAGPVTITVPMGTTCHHDEYWGHNAPHFYQGLPKVTVKAAGVQTGLMGSEPCTTVTWDPSTHFVPVIGNDEIGKLPIGHLVVDKIGEAQSTGSGVIATPFRSHFVWFPIGKALEARHLAQPAVQPADEEVQLQKDADGKWVARIVIV